MTVCADQEIAMKNQSNVRESSYNEVVSTDKPFYQCNSAHIQNFCTDETWVKGLAGKRLGNAGQCDPRGGLQGRETLKVLYFSKGPTRIALRAASGIFIRRT